MKERKIKDICYLLEIKNVKNVNLRIRDGKIFVSANRKVGLKFIDDFVISKRDFILKAIERQNIHIDENTQEELNLKECENVFLDILNPSFCRKRFVIIFVFF